MAGMLHHIASFRIGVLCLCGVFAGCDEFNQTVDDVSVAVDDAARAQAKTVVTKTLVTRFPAVPKAAVTPFSDCVIDHATGPEIRALIGDAVTQIDDETALLVRQILTRPETQNCIASRGVGLLGRT